MPRTSTTTKATKPKATKSLVSPSKPPTMPEVITPILTICATRPDAFVVIDAYGEQGTLHLWLCSQPEAYRTPPLTIIQGDLRRIETGISLTPDAGHYLVIRLLPLLGFALAQYAADGSWLDLHNVNSHLAFHHGEALATFRLMKKIPFMAIDTTQTQKEEVMK